MIKLFCFIKVKIRHTTMEMEYGMEWNMTSPENNMLVAVYFRDYITPSDTEITAFFINN